MEIKNIKGIIISDKAYGESSKILNVITKEYGLLNILAKGAKRLKSPYRSSCERFNYADFEISYKKEKLSTLISVDVINSLNNIKKDIEKISYVNFISDLTNQVLKQSDSKFIYDDYLNSILKINDGFDPMIITNILEIKYLDFLGVSPELNGCVICGNKNVVALSSNKGGFVCKDHHTNEYYTNEKTIKIIRMLKYVDISKISKIELSSLVKNEINSFLNEYYDSYTGLYLKSKDFLKNIVKIK